MCTFCDHYYNNLLKNYKRNENTQFEDIVVNFYAQKSTSEISAAEC